MDKAISETKFGEDKSTMMEKSAAENKKSFMENYGITFQIPSLQVLGAQFYKKDPRYMI